MAKDKAGDFDGEIADETRAIELDPKYAVAWADRGWARSRKDDWDGTIADSTRAIELKPGLAQAWSNRGLARGTKGDLDGEIADARKAIEIDPKLAHPWSHIAWAELQKGDTKAALADFDEAVKRLPEQGFLYRQRGLAHALVGDRKAALDDLLVAHRLDPADPHALLWHAGLGGDEELLRPFAHGTSSTSGVVRFYLREITRDELLAGPAGASTEHERQERLCEAQGYLGLLAEREGDMVRARAAYEACVATGATQWLQYTWAEQRLRQLR